MFITIKDTAFRISSITIVRKGTFVSSYCIYIKADGVEYRFEYDKCAERDNDYTRIMDKLLKE